MEKFVLNAALIVMTALAVASCKGKKEETLTPGNLPPVVVLNGKVDQCADGICGSGLVRFEQALGNAKSSLVLDLKASLTKSQSGVLVLSHAKDLLLNEAAMVSLYRVGNSVAGSILLNNRTVRIADARLSGLNPLSMELTLEIRNTGNQLRVLMWPFNAEARDDRDAFFDSFISGHTDTALPAYSPNGIYSGLKLQDATVTYARPL